VVKSNDFGRLGVCRKTRGTDGIGLSKRRFASWVLMVEEPELVGTGTMPIEDQFISEEDFTAIMIKMSTATGISELTDGNKMTCLEFGQEMNLAGSGR